MATLTNTATKAIQDLSSSEDDQVPGVDFSQVIERLFEREGGEANLPGDRGGRTKFGISSVFNPDVDLNNLTKKQATNIYKKRYWDTINADKLPSNIREMAFDSAVLHGVSWTKRALAESKGDPEALKNLRLDRVEQAIRGNPANEKFRRGWENRINSFITPSTEGDEVAGLSSEGDTAQEEIPRNISSNLIAQANIPQSGSEVMSDAPDEQALQNIINFDPKFYKLIGMNPDEAIPLLLDRQKRIQELSQPKPELDINQLLSMDTEEAINVLLYGKSGQLPKLEQQQQQQQQQPEEIEKIEIYKDPDSFFSGVGRSFNESQKGIAEFAGVLGRIFNFPSLEEWSKNVVAQQQEDIESYGQPTRTASFTKGLEEIGTSYKEKGAWEAMERGGNLLKDMLASATGSLLPVVGAGVAAAATGAAMTAVGIPGAGILTLLSPFLVGTAIFGGQVREEAINTGASPEKADAAALIVAPIGGILDRFGAASIISNLTKGLGKEAVIEAAATQVGKEAAKTAVEKALSFSKKVVTGGTKAALKETGTEMSQEALQVAAAGVAADKGLQPLEAMEYTNRLIDAGALGFIGGKAFGTVSEMTALKLERDMAKRAEEVEKIQEQMQKAFPDHETEISSNFGILTSLSQSKKLRENRGQLANIYRSAISPLYQLARRSETGARIVNYLQNYPNKVSSEFGKYFEQLEPLFLNLKRSFRIPLIQKEIPKQINNRLLKVLQTGELDADNNINETASKIREILGTVREEDIDPVTGTVKPEVKLTLEDVKSAVFDGKAIDSLKDGLNNQSVSLNTFYDIQQAIQKLSNDFNTRLKNAPNESEAIKKSVMSSNSFKELVNKTIFKPRLSGLAQNFAEANPDFSYVQNYFPRIHKTGVLNNRKRTKVLMDRGKTRQAALSISENIEKNDGIYDFKEGELPPIGQKERKKLTSYEIDAENKRKLTEEDVQALQEAGLMETDVPAVLSKYILDAARRSVGKELADNLNKELSGMSSKDITPVEVDIIKDIYSATQHNYKPLKDKNIQNAQKWLLTSQYILKLPLAGITSLSEPLLILSRISPKYALFGASKGIYNALRSGLRTVFPKLPKLQQEKILTSFLEGADGILAERFGDISGVTAARKITNAFFKATLLTTVTQISRDMAFQAARMQMKNDLKIIRKVEGPLKKPKTIEYIKAKRRLLEQGLVEPNSDILQDWANGQLEVDPDIIRQSMAKTVNEFIMSPNAVNRPLWMSNPHLALVAQLKGFMFTFGNVVGGRFWREVIVPTLKGRVPDAAMLQYGIALVAIMGMSMFLQGLKDEIRYGDKSSESPFSKMDGSEQIIHSLLSTNILGGFGFLVDALEAKKYGSSFWPALLGPTASTIEGLASGAYNYTINDKPRQMAREIANLLPFLSMIPIARDVKKEAVDTFEEKLKNIRSTIVN